MLMDARVLAVTTFNRPREIKRSQVRLLETLGEGTFGTVRKSLIDEKTSLGVPSYLAAVKECISHDSGALQEVLLEASVMAQLNHPPLLQLVCLNAILDFSSTVLELFTHSTRNFTLIRCFSILGCIVS